jgi:hypothetical protein
VDPNRIPSIPNFIQIRPAALELNHDDRQTGSVLRAFISCTSCKERLIINKLLQCVRVAAVLSSCYPHFVTLLVACVSQHTARLLLLIQNLENTQETTVRRN